MSYIVQFHLYEVSRVRKSIETTSRLLVARRWWKGGIAGEWDFAANEYGFVGARFWAGMAKGRANENVLKFYYGDGCTT